MTEIERSLLTTKSFNTNLVHMFYHHIMSLLVTSTSALIRARFCTCMDVHLKQFCVHETLCTKRVQNDKIHPYYVHIHHMTVIYGTHL